jgi:hypothetical protein
MLADLAGRASSARQMLAGTVLPAGEEHPDDECHDGHTGDDHAHLHPPRHAMPRRGCGGAGIIGVRVGPGLMEFVIHELLFLLRSCLVIVRAAMMGARP